MALFGPLNFYGSSLFQTTTGVEATRARIGLFGKNGQGKVCLKMCKKIKTRDLPH
jgi:ATPase subunit of ABC transporter with duplicated ATPase domains